MKGGAESRRGRVVDNNNSKKARQAWWERAYVEKLDSRPERAAAFGCPNDLEGLATHGLVVATASSWGLMRGGQRTGRATVDKQRGEVDRVDPYDGQAGSPKAGRGSRQHR